MSISVNSLKCFQTVKKLAYVMMQLISNIFFVYFLILGIKLYGSVHLMAIAWHEPRFFRHNKNGNEIIFLHDSSYNFFTVLIVIIYFLANVDHKLHDFKNN